MARIETDPNYSTPTFSRATAGTDIFKKEDVQALAAAMSTHVHDGAGKGLPVAFTGTPAGSIPGTALADGSVTSAKIADGTIVAADIADGTITSAKIADGTIATADLANASVTVRLLDVTTTGDLLNGTVLVAATWMPLMTPISFTVTDSNSIVEICARGVCNVTAAVQAGTGSQVLLDSAGLALGGSMIVANGFANCLAGGESIFVTGLAAGTHTVSVRIVAQTSATAYCRPATMSQIYEHMEIQVVEHKR